jgi:MerR family transcriptional regulator, light-induced transcriptional regulator
MHSAHQVPEKYRSDYLHAVLNREKATAEEVVLAMIREGSSLADVYRVLGAAQVEVGSLWERGSITVSDEHFATGVTLDCVSMAADRLRTFRREPTGFAYLSPAEGEFHIVGLMMLSELLRSDGWETALNRSGTLQPALRELTANRKVKLFCLSATMPSNVPGVVKAVQAIRRTPAFGAAKILVGGPAFEHAEDREAIQVVSAGTSHVDCLASNFSEAVGFARLIAQQSRQG